MIKFRDPHSAGNIYLNPDHIVQFYSLGCFSYPVTRIHLVGTEVVIDVLEDPDTVCRMIADYRVGRVVLGSSLDSSIDHV